MEDNMKTILFSNVPIEKQTEISLVSGLNRLKEYAEKKGYEVIDEYQSSCGEAIGFDPVFHSVLEIIDSLNERIRVLCYMSVRGERSELYSNVLKKQLIEFESVSHPCFDEIPDSKKIWRYLTLPKFIDLLEKQSLFFSRADLLRSEDSSEASYRTDMERSSLSRLNTESMDLPHPFIPDQTLGEFVRFEDGRERSHEFSARENYINCWHINDFENFAMWKIYSEAFGVCIQSSFRSLYESINDDKYDFYGVKHKVYLGKVAYIDWNKDFIPKDNTFWSFMHKRKEFEYEQELRGVVWHSCTGYGDVPTHINVGVDIQRMIETVYVNPDTPAWFKPLVESLCLKYGYQIRIVQSQLARK